MREKQRLIVLYRQFAALLSQDISINEAIEIIGEERDGSQIQNKMVNLSEDLRKGIPLSEGLARYSEIFQPLLVESIERDLSGVSLSQIFLALAKDNEQSGTLRKKLKRSLIYPCCVILLALVLMSVMLIFVIPVFSEMYTGFGASLPQPTLILMSLASAFYGHGLLAIFLTLALVVLLLFMGNSVLRWSTWIPGLRTLTKTIFLSRLSLFLAALSGCGLSPKDMLQMATGPLFSSSWKKKLHAVIEDADTTDTGVEMMRRTEIFPSFYLQMVRVGERGSIDAATFTALVEYYETEFQCTERRLVVVLDIVAICAAALLVALFVFALYLPMFRLTEVI